MPFHIIFLSFFIIISIPNIALITLYHKTPIITFISLFTILASSTMLIVLYDILVLPIRQIRDVVFSVLGTKVLLFNNKKYNEMYEMQYAVTELTTYYRDCCATLDTHVKLQKKKDAKISNYITSTKDKEKETQSLLDYSQHSIKKAQIFHQQLHTMLIQALNGMAKASISLEKQHGAFKPNNITNTPNLNLLTKNIRAAIKSTEYIHDISTKGAKDVIESIKAIDNIKTNLLDLKKTLQLLFKKIEKLTDLSITINTLTKQVSDSTFKTSRVHTQKNMFSILTKKIQITLEHISTTVKNLMANINVIQTQSDKTLLSLENTNQTILNASISITNAGMSINNLIKNFKFVKTRIYELQTMAISQTKKNYDIQQQINTFTARHAKTSLTIEHFIKQILIAIKLMEEVWVTLPDNKNMLASKQKLHYNQQTAPESTTNIPVLDYLYQGLYISLNILFKLIHKDTSPPGLQQMLTSIRCSILNIVQIELSIHSKNETYSEYIQQIERILRKIEYALRTKQKENCYELLDKLKQSISSHIEHISKQYLENNNGTISALGDIIYT